MPPKFMNFQEEEPVKKKRKAPVLVRNPALALAVPSSPAPSSRSSTRPQKDKGKATNLGTSHKWRRGVGTSSVGTSLSTSATAPKLLALVLSIGKLERQVALANTA